MDILSAESADITKQEKIIVCSKSGIFYLQVSNNRNLEAKLRFFFGNKFNWVEGG